VGARAQTHYHIEPDPHASRTSKRRVSYRRLRKQAAAACLEHQIATRSQTPHTGLRVWLLWLWLENSPDPDECMTHMPGPLHHPGRPPRGTVAKRAPTRLVLRFGLKPSLCPLRLLLGLAGSMRLVPGAPIRTQSALMKPRPNPKHKHKQRPNARTQARAAVPAPR
jgi:hypothetical protein